jgi:CDP-glucose 4,6-dehydratase
MENLVNRAPVAEQFRQTYGGKRVFVTGHTGFKGGWLCEWLLHLGAEVAGFSLAPGTVPSLFDQLNLNARMNHQVADLRDPSAVKTAVTDFAPDYIFHLAAQPLVRLSYKNAVETFETNVMGTVHLLEAARALERSCAVVAVATDKCYRNNETGQRFSENDPLGGNDPYSASKAAAELAVAAYHHSFFCCAGSRIALASARAGNVIGGGDWAPDRIVPDAISALSADESIPVRNPSHVRPWQHVLDALSGYLLLGARIHDSPELRAPFNFGPAESSARTVAELIEEILRTWPGKWHQAATEGAVGEQSVLRLSIDKARSLLHWRPTWDFAATVFRTVEWYRDQRDAREKTRDQIRRFEAQMSLAA